MEYLFIDKKQYSNNNYYYNVLLKKKGKIYRSLYDEIVKWGREIKLNIKLFFPRSFQRFQNPRIHRRTFLLSSAESDRSS